MSLLIARLLISELPVASQACVPWRNPSLSPSSHDLSYHNKSCLPLIPPSSLILAGIIQKILLRKKSNMKTVKNRLFFTHDKIISRQTFETKIRLLIFRFIYPPIGALTNFQARVNLETIQVFKMCVLPSLLQRA